MKYQLRGNYEKWKSANGDAAADFVEIDISIAASFERAVDFWFASFEPAYFVEYGRSYVRCGWGAHQDFATILVCFAAAVAGGIDDAKRAALSIKRITDLGFELDVEG